MKSSHTTRRSAFIAIHAAVCGILLMALSADAQYRDGSVHHPAPMNPGEVSVALGLSVSMLPKSIVGEMAPPVPMLRVAVRAGLPAGVSVHASLNGVYLTNHATVGVEWSRRMDAVTVATGLDGVYWFGFADTDIFDASANGIVIAPYTSVNVDLPGCVLGLRGELMFAQSVNAELGETSISETRGGLSGTAITLSLQKDIYRNIDIILGVRIQYSAPGHELWMAFANPNRWSVTPSVLLGYVI